MCSYGKTKAKAGSKWAIGVLPKRQMPVATPTQRADAIEIRQGNPLGLATTDMDNMAKTMTAPKECEMEH
jgi:hypothetical protein